MKPKTTWHNKYLVLIGLLSLSLLLVGCIHSEDEKQKDENQGKQQKQKVIKKPPEKNQMDLETMYSRCMNRDYQVVSRYDQKQDKNIRYCRFNDGTECRLEKFAKGGCGPGKNSKEISFQSTISPRNKNCQQYKPVCGEDGRTYANECLTKKLNINIKHQGSCKQEDRKSIETNQEIDFIKPKQDSSEQENPKVKQKKKKENQIPKWINMVVALVKNSPKTNPSMKIKKCNPSDNTKYLQTNGTDNTVSTLYNKQGEVICHPSRDFSDLCPNNINSIQNNCKVIWEDKR